MLAAERNAAGDRDLPRGLCGGGMVGVGGPGEREGDECGHGEKSGRDGPVGDVADGELAGGSDGVLKGVDVRDVP